jgi:hypothetical protein
MTLFAAGLIVEAKPLRQDSFHGRSSYTIKNAMLIVLCCEKCVLNHGVSLSAFAIPGDLASGHTL